MEPPPVPKRLWARRRRAPETEARAEGQLPMTATGRQPSTADIIARHDLAAPERPTILQLTPVEPRRVVKRQLSPPGSGGRPGDIDLSATGPKNIRLVDARPTPVDVPPTPLERPFLAFDPFAPPDARPILRAAETPAQAVSMPRAAVSAGHGGRLRVPAHDAAGSSRRIAGGSEDAAVEGLGKDLANVALDALL